MAKHAALTDPTVFIVGIDAISSGLDILGAYKMHASVVLASLVAILVASPAVAQGKLDAIPGIDSGKVSVPTVQPERIDFAALNQDLASKAKAARPIAQTPRPGMDDVAKMVAGAVDFQREIANHAPHF